MRFYQKGESAVMQEAIFFIKNSETAAKWVTTEDLRADEKKLSLSNWQPVLCELGWDLTRPPKTKLNYDEDCFSLEVELPTSLVAHNGDKESYCRTIASFLFPHQAISELPIEIIEPLNPRGYAAVYRPKS